MTDIGAERDRSLDGMRIVRAGEGRMYRLGGSRVRELIAARETGSRWGLVEVTADPGDDVGTHVHRDEPEAFIVVDGEMELHGAEGVTPIGPGDVVLIPPNTEHGLRTPHGGRWLAIWPAALDGLLGGLEGAGDDPQALSDLRRRHGMEPGTRYRRR